MMRNIKIWIALLIGMLIGGLSLYMSPARTSLHPGSVEQLEQIYDGDTIRDVRVRISDEATPIGELWPGIYKAADGIYVEFDLRLAGIDTPEKRPSKKARDGTLRSEASREKERAAAMAARAALIQLLEKHKGEFYVANPQIGKYAGRFVGTLLVGEEKQDAAQYLIEHGHAKAYEGGTKPVWDW